MEDQDSQFREIFEKSPIGIIFYNRNGIVVNANNSALKMLGFPQLDDVRGHNLFDNTYISEKKDELLREGIIKFQAPLNLEKIKDYGLHSNKKGVIFLDYTVSVTDSGFLTQIQDITEHKKAGEQLKHSETRYHSLYENSFDAILLTKPD
ncbi:MAG: PAS domain S-box protein, partial [Methanobacterium sp.]